MLNAKDYIDGARVLTLIAIFGGLVVLMVAIAWWRKDRTPFKKKQFLNKPERVLFDILIKSISCEHHLMCQVSYGAIMQNRSRNRYMSINSKRADFMIFDQNADVVAVLEYQGSGHFGRTRESKKIAQKSDAIKRASLKESGIPLLEVPAKYSTSLVHEFIADLATQTKKDRPIAQS